MFSSRKRPAIRRIRPAPAETPATKAVSRVPEEFDDEAPTMVGRVLAPAELRELMDDAEKNLSEGTATAEKPAMRLQPRSGVRPCVRPEDYTPRVPPALTRPSEIEIEVDLSSLEPAIEVHHLHDEDEDF